LVAPDAFSDWQQTGGIMALKTLRRVLLIVCAGVVLVAMVAVMPARATPGALQVTVTPKVSAADAPLTIRVSGAQPGASVTLTVTSVDAVGIKWSSTSMYTASSAGTIDPATTEETAFYNGTDPMGPVDFMNAAPIASAKATIWPFGLPSPWFVSNTKAQPMYSWAECPLSQAQHGCTWSKPLSFTFTATSGQTHASVTVERGPVTPVTASFESVAATGFYGVFWQPPAGQDNHIGVVEFTGSSGGINNPVGAMLAMHGYPTLDLAYFGEPGLPQAAKGLSLEYFAKALRWLGTQPGVNARRLWVIGWSGGSEAAFLLGVHYPGLVHGVAALAPYQVVICAALTGQAWSLAGKLLPCTKQVMPYPTDNPAAVIPVAKIHGPVFVDCPEADSSGTCDQAKAVMAELAAAHDTYPHELLDYPAAAHGVGLLLPYYPGIAFLETAWQLAGDGAVANPLARADQWPKLLAFLRN
jgi:dienelactone hydrolase